MDHNRAKMLHALAESFGFAERPSPSEDPVRFRYWERARTAIDSLVSEQAQGGDVDHALRVIVLTCGQLGAVEPQACAACLASALGVDLRPVLRTEAA